MKRGATRSLQQQPHAVKCFKYTVNFIKFSVLERKYYKTDSLVWTPKSSTVVNLITSNFSEIFKIAILEYSIERPAYV